MKLLSFFTGLGLASRIGVIVCALAAHSCLVPQSVDPIVDAAHPPPRLVLESIPSYLLSPIVQLYRQGSADQAAAPPCHCELELSVPFVEEDDPTITLEVRWFVDYDVSVPASVRAWETNTVFGSFDSPGTIRPLPPFHFDADALSIATNGVHLVEVVVAETAAFEPNSTTRPNRKIKTGYTSAEHSFTVNVKVDFDSARPQCPSEPPSVKVCQ